MTIRIQEQITIGKQGFTFKTQGLIMSQSEKCQRMSYENF